MELIGGFLNLFLNEFSPKSDIQGVHNIGILIIYEAD